MGNLRDKISFRLAYHSRLSTLRVRPERGIVSFTFDDGLKSAATTGAATLEARGVRGTYYLCGATIGGKGDLDEPVVSANEARDLARRGHEIGCHTNAHRDVRRASRADLASDLDANAETIGALCGDGPQNFAYPFGHIGIEAKLRLGRRFDTCRGIYPGLNVGSVDRAHLRAAALYSGQMDAAEAARWIGEAARQKAWLIFFTHDVSETPTPYGVTPDLLSYCIDRALAAGCDCLPVSGALQTMRAAIAPKLRSPAAAVAVSGSRV